MEFSSPVQVLWEIDEVRPESRRILEDLARVRIFYLALAFRGEVDGAFLGEAAGRLPGCRITLEARPEAAGRLLGSLPRGIPFLNLDVTDVALPQPEWLAGFRARLAQISPATLPAVKMELWGSTLDRVGPLLDLCRASGIRRAVLSNPRFVGGSCRGPEDVLDRSHHHPLEQVLAARQGWLDEVDPIIHDYFVWDLFARYRRHPPERGEAIGCQAANALAYIDPSGELYGCSTLRLGLGSLRERTLQELWGSPLRRHVRRMLEEQPEVCRTCAHYSTCRSGCRGTVELLHGDFDEADPGCPFYAPSRAPEMTLRVLL